MDKKKAMLKKLKELKKMARDEYSSPLKDKMKVTVMADDAEGLEEGLEQAESMAEKIKKGMLGDMMGEEEEREEEDREEESEEDSEEESKKDEEEKDSDEYEEGEMDYDEEQDEVSGEQDTDPDEYMEGGIEKEMEKALAEDDDPEFAGISGHDQIEDLMKRKDGEKDREARLQELVDLGLLTKEEMKKKLKA